MRKWLKITAWSTFIILIIVGLFFAKSYNNSLPCAVPDIKFEKFEDMNFLNSADVQQRLSRANLFYEGMPQEDLDIPAIEQLIAEMNEVEHVEVHNKLGSKWEINMKLRRPIARIFGKGGESFYLDDKGFPMSTSRLHTAHVVVVTGINSLSINSIPYPDLINNDSLITISKLDDVYRISDYVCNDAFLCAQISQIHYDNSDGFILIPRVGKQKIIFGEALTEESVKTKFDKLELFYKDVVPYVGWDKYQSINLKFDKQIVGKK